MDDHLREFAFVTNKHNIDPSIKLGSGYILRDLKIELRKREQVEHGSSFVLLPKTEFFGVTALQSSLHVCDQADCAVIYPVTFVDKLENFLPFSAFRLSDLAEKTFFDNYLHLTDPCHFVGFPADAEGKRCFWNTEYSTPISRFASIASHPATYIPFSNNLFSGHDIVLVSGLSFFGSSGSPVISDQAGIGTDHPDLELGESKFIKTVPKRINCTDKTTYATPNVDYYFVDENFTSSKLVGIMTGHYNVEVQSKLEHSGLSYFTRSTSIIEAMKKAGFSQDNHGIWNPTRA